MELTTKTAAHCTKVIKNLYVIDISLEVHMYIAVTLTIDIFRYGGQ